ETPFDRVALVQNALALAWPYVPFPFPWLIPPTRRELSYHGTFRRPAASYWRLHLPAPVHFAGGDKEFSKAGKFSGGLSIFVMEEAQSIYVRLVRRFSGDSMTARVFIDGAAGTTGL